MNAYDWTKNEYSRLYHECKEQEKIKIVEYKYEVIEVKKVQKKQAGT